MTGIIYKQETGSGTSATYVTIDLGYGWYLVHSLTLDLAQSDALPAVVGYRWAKGEKDSYQYVPWVTGFTRQWGGLAVSTPRLVYGPGKLYGAFVPVDGSYTGTLIAAIQPVTEAEAMAFMRGG